MGGEQTKTTIAKRRANRHVITNSEYFRRAVVFDLPEGVQPVDLIGKIVDVRVVKSGSLILMGELAETARKVV